MDVKISIFFGNGNGIGREFHFELFCIGISDSFPISIDLKFDRNSEWLTMKYEFKTFSNNLHYQMVIGNLITFSICFKFTFLLIGCRK
ncbi:hypothetical protein ACE6H2_001737 [Prunus campanulata]